MATPDIFSAPPRPAVEGGPPFDLVSDFEQDYVTVDTGVSGDIHLIGHNLKAHLAKLNKRNKPDAGEKLQRPWPCRHRNPLGFRERVR